MMRLPTDLAAALARKRLIFTVTTGRSGTALLAKALDVAADVHAVHESPGFTECMRGAQADSGLARDLWLRLLPEIAGRPEGTYAETGHLVCKGFLEPLLEIGVVPDLILLERRARDVALSLTELGTVPARTEKGRRFLLEPNDPGVLPLPRWEELEPYQLNYWYCLEIARRRARYASEVAERGGRVVELPFDELVDPRAFHRFWRAFELPPLGILGRLRLRRTLEHKVNSKGERKQGTLRAEPERLDELEREVRARVGAVGLASGA